MEKFDSLVATIKKFNKDREWGKFHTPRNLATSISLEAAEVLEKFQWKLNDEVTKEEIEELKDELADVLIYVIDLSAALNIDLLDAANRKLEKCALKYPIEKSKGKSTKYTKL